MSEHCCHSMRFFTKSLAEHQDKATEFLTKIGEDASKPPPLPSNAAEPLINFRQQPAVYTIGCVAILYCPWCGTKLPMPDVNGMPTPIVNAGERYITRQEIQN